MSSFLDMMVKEHQRAMFFVSKPLFIQYHGKKCDNPQISMRVSDLGHGVPKTQQTRAKLIPGSDDVHLSLDIAKEMESE
jgi:hypothetical protein